MKINVEPFLLDNALMNYCVFALAAAWMGVRIRFLPIAAVSVLGAVYALLSLFVLPVLRQPYLKAPLFLLASLPLYRNAGPFYRTLPFLLLSAATVGGTALMLTLLLGGSVASDGTLIGTVPVRAALISAAAALCLPRLLRAMLRVRKKRGLYTTVEIRLSQHTYRLNALIDSGNLLTEPLSGLPVVLIDRAIDAPSRPIPFQKISGEGMLYGERAKQVILPAYGGCRVDCYCASAPGPIAGAEAILPESLLPQEWRTKHARMAETVLGPPAQAAARWQTRYLLVHSYKRESAGVARSGGGGAVH